MHHGIATALMIVGSLCCRVGFAVEVDQELQQLKARVAALELHHSTGPQLALP
jgi:hypothetical protein